jgi:hypothetical protein
MTRQEHPPVKHLILTLVALLALPAPAASQSVSDAAGSIGFSQPPSGKPSLSISLLYGRHGRWIGAQLWGDMLLSENTESVYYRDGSVCRNGDTGEFADSYQCGPAVDFAARGELGLRIPDSGLSFGPGFRLAEDRSQPYGYVQYERGGETGSFFLVRALGGQKLVQVEVGVGLGWGHSDAPEPSSR